MSKNKTGFKKIEKKISRTRKPDDMSVEEWQIALRRQFGREQKFILKKDLQRPDDLDFLVTNPESKNTYRVALRSTVPGKNYCSCPDFSSNTLLTCKHIEFSLAKLERSRKLSLLKNARVQAYSSVFVQYGNEQKLAFEPASNASPQLLKLSAQFFDEEGFFRHETFNKFQKFQQALQILSDKVHVYDDALRLIQNKNEQQLFKNRIDDFFPQGISSATFDDLLAVPLYPYQREGALFAARNGRVLIADEMGLGKTIQAIAAAEILAQVMRIQRVLIVCPTSLKHQWQSEIEKFSKRSALVVNGLLKKRQETYATSSFFKIINYDVVYKDIALINSWQPDLVILDEAQRIKNWKTRAAKSVKLLQSRFAIVLTGTPLENRLEELHSIVSFIDRQRLGPLFRFLHNHQVNNEFGKVTGYHNLDQIGESLKPILLRRHKSEVLQQLPERTDKTFFIPMTEEQWLHHDENYEGVCKIVNKWRKMGFLSDQDQKRLMMFLQNMRMSCNSTYLLDSKTDHGRKIPEIITLLKEILEEPNIKVVIFSQWLRSHELILKHLEKSKMGYVFFHGGVESSKRRDLIHKFKQDENCRLFLSTDAGGVGLNLQNASVVINVDQPWNPAVLEQRIGRVHRMGQKEKVRVYNFVAEKTIEESMLGVLKFKKGLFSGVLDGGEREIHFEGSRLKKFMETIEAITQEQEQIQHSENSSQAENTETLSSQVIPLPQSFSETQNASVPIAPTLAQPINWEDLISSGMDLVQKFMTQVAQPKTQNPESMTQANSPREWLKMDTESGQIKLNIPLPKPETLNKLGQVFALVKELMG
ncbi:MAG: DEAD/DEAH box helicase family protein [Deltaproteobacteria bacterium]|nr:DEAD/DEAH box helicase family protein [Deltaproteobacteria bacterium]